MLDLAAFAPTLGRSARRDAADAGRTDFLRTRFLREAVKNAELSPALTAAVAAIFFLNIATVAAAQETPPAESPSPAGAPTTPTLPAAAPALPVPPPVPTRTAPASVSPPGPGEVRVRIVTADGPIVVDLDRKAAPLTTANFLKYVDQHRFDGTGFYRATKVGPAGLGLVQGGVRGDPKRILPPVAHEPTTKTGLAHIEGTISMARLAPGSARGDFFITTGPLSSLDAHPQETGDNAGFAAFGHVVAGLDVVRRILGQPTDDSGSGVMRGQMLAKPVKIVSVRRDG